MAKELVVGTLQLPTLGMNIDRWIEIIKYKAFLDTFYILDTNNEIKLNFYDVK